LESTPREAEIVVHDVTDVPRRIEVLRYLGGDNIKVTDLYRVVKKIEPLDSPISSFSVETTLARDRLAD
jgi:hypothetical protein